jgi:cation:H+ antiporter
LGHALGSCVADILLILGAAALICPLQVPIRRLWRDLGVMLLAAAAIWIMQANGTVSRFDGLLLPAGLAAFLTIAIAGSEAVTDPGGGPAAPVWQAAALAPGGLVMLVIGADLPVDSASETARGFGISPAVIGLTP